MATETRKFTVEVRDYEQGTDRPLTATRLENVVRGWLDRRGDDGVVIVADAPEPIIITDALVQQACLAYGPHSFPERMRAALETVVTR